MSALEAQGCEGERLRSRRWDVVVRPRRGRGMVVKVAWRRALTGQIMWIMFDQGFRSGECYGDIVRCSSRSCYVLHALYGDNGQRAGGPVLELLPREAEWSTGLLLAAGPVCVTECRDTLAAYEIDIL